jgi:hypothetical protein
MPKPKPKQIREPLKCALPPEEALRRAMLVGVPPDWKKPARASKTARR